eukprot:358312-Chlamydomonas_euryale.AAC.2
MCWASARGGTPTEVMIGFVAARTVGFEPQASSRVHLTLKPLLPTAQTTATDRSVLLPSAPTAATNRSNRCYQQVQPLPLTAQIAANNRCNRCSYAIHTAL